MSIEHFPIVIADLIDVDDRSVVSITGDKVDGFLGRVSRLLFKAKVFFRSAFACRRTSIGRKH